MRKKISVKDIPDYGGEDPVFVEGHAIKAVVDIKQCIMAINGEYHSYIEDVLHAAGSDYRDLYGVNIDVEKRKVYYDSMTNLYRNKESGRAKDGMEIKDPDTKKKIDEVIDTWITGL